VPRRLDGLPHGDGRDGEDRDRHDGCRDDPEPVPRHELRPAVPEGVGLRADRLVVQVAAQVVRLYYMEPTPGNAPTEIQVAIHWRGMLEGAAQRK
jgi:hypothetical protein